MSCTSPAAASSGSSGYRCWSRAAVCRAWSSCETAAPAYSGRAARGGEQLHDLVGPEAGRPLAHRLILPRCGYGDGPCPGPHRRAARGPTRWSRSAAASATTGARMVSLRPEDLRAAAAATTGLDDFGDSWWEEPFRRLCASLDAEARLHLPGRLRTRGELQLILQNRLRMVELWKREPAVLREPVPGAHRRDRPRALGHDAAARAARLRPRQPPAAALGAAALRPLRGRVGRPVRRRDHAHGRDGARLHGHARERRPPPDRVHLRLRPPVLERHVHRPLQRGRVHGVAQRAGPDPDLRLAQAPPADAAVGGRATDARAGSSRRPPTFPPCPWSSRPTPTPGW